MFYSPIKILLKRLLLLLLIYQLARVAFYVANAPTFAEISGKNVALAFLHGLRFDLSAILVTNIPFLIFSLAPPQFLAKPAYQKFLKWIFFLVNIPFLLINLVDTEYFKFIGRRSTNEIITITSDIQTQAAQLIQNYWYILVFLFLVSVALYYLYPQKFVPQKQNWRRGWWQVALLATGFVILIRGGFQYKPLRVSDAFILEPPVLGNLVLNSTFTFIRSLNKTTLEKAVYFKNKEDLLEVIDFNPQKNLQVNGPPIRDNVVIIILESFGSEYTGIENEGKGYTPFFDSLATNGLFFRENYANGRRSIEALPSILSGLPNLMNNPFMASAYQGNEIYGIGNVLKPLGYHTSFYHGGANGTMSFNIFARMVGFDTYFGLDEYPKANTTADFDGNWGIFDEPYLQYFSSQLTKQPQPFLSVVFTLSAHPPYTLPVKYSKKFPQGPLPIHQPIGYSDYALKQFFKTASQQPWYPNTLFILTADHSQHNYLKSYKNRLGFHKVPLLLFRPGKEFKNINTNKITQHTDIMPTIIDYLNVPTNKLLPFGKSVLDAASTGKALLYSDNIYTLVHPDYITDLHPDGKTNLFKYKSHGFIKLKHQPDPVKTRYGKELKAYVQYYRNSMVENNLYYWLHPASNKVAVKQ